MPEAEVETATRIVYRAAWSPRVVKQDNGKYSVQGVPIFMRHRREGHNYDDAWFAKAVTTQYEDKAGGFLPRLIKGHTSDNPNARCENPAWGFLDNYRYDAASGWLYADYVDLTADVKDEIVAGRWPGRSVEVVPEKHAIRAVAMLGESVPWFKLPDLKFAERYGEEAAVCYSITSPPAIKPEPESKPMPESTIDPVKYAETVAKVTALEAEKADLATKYAEQAKQISSLAAQLEEQSAISEKASWIGKYAEKRIPAGRLDINGEVEFIMALPKGDLRAKYFERSISNLSAPSQKPATLPDAATAGPMVRGTARYFEAFSAYAAKDEVVAKYGTDLVKLRKAFETDNKITA